MLGGDRTGVKKETNHRRNHCYNRVLTVLEILSEKEMSVTASLVESSLVQRSLEQETEP